MIVSVILPSFNDQAHLGDALARLRRQRGIDIEVIVVDDGSNDASPAIAERAARDDRRIRALRLEANGGVALARRRGVLEARGDYVWFVDSDDDWPDDAAAVLAAKAEATGADVVVAGALFRLESGRTKQLAPPSGDPVDGRIAFTQLLTGGITGHLWNKLFRRSLLTQIEYVPARVQSDLAMVAGALARAGSVAFLDRTVYEYRIRPGSIITSRSRRADSLRLIEAGVRRAASLLPGVVDGPAHRYFVTRYILLSGIKDATFGDYSDEERGALLAELRRRLTLRELRLLASARDVRRLALAATAKWSRPLYRRLLVIADR
ncbi:glycosyltransferase family 2 protein [Naasia sp. SYSU D00948]|uniref:glycosyltransferase family 2 protein n=1 Tax=Naasia sp. SYSU D00948 TaxID=2817379 RepID=UPI001B302A79|nr:glycosyltransferase family 2 protein [Naasia sp. SYSU D00948]